MVNEQLVLLIKGGIDTTDNMLQLWQQNQGFIWKIANIYKGYEDIEDLRQQGYIGLCDAVQGYRPEENVPFINYAALWVRQSMKRYIESSGNVVKLPSHSWQKQIKYKKLLHDFALQVGREPTDWEICRYMGISYKELEGVKQAAQMSNIGSLDIHIGAEGDSTIGDFVQGNDDVESTVLDEIEKEELKEMLWSMVDKLQGNQPQVLRSLFQEGKTLKATGEEIGVTTERIRVIRQNALKELRKPSRKRMLIAYLPEAMECIAYRHNGVDEFNRTWTSSTELAALKIYEEITGNVLY